MAFIPCGSQVFRAHGGFMERLGVGSCMEIEERHIRIKAVDGLRISDTNLRQTSAAIGAKLAQIHVKGAIFLQHEENVLNGARGGSCNGERSTLLDRCAIRRNGGCGVDRKSV